MKDHHLSIRMSAEQKEALEAKASELGMTCGQLARKLLALGSGVAEEAPSSARTYHEPGQARSREAELRWLRENRTQLNAYAGQWLILEGDHLVAHGSDYLDVLREAREKGVVVPFAYRVPELEGDVVWMGL